MYLSISEYQMINVCSFHSSKDSQSIYLTSPKYPRDQLEPIKCFCNLTGQNISAEVYEHQKSNDSQTVLMFVTDKVVLHVNDVKIRNQILFSDTNSVQMILDNAHRPELFKLWIHITGKSKLA